MSNTQLPEKGTWELDFIESALQAYWVQAHQTLGRKDLGDIERNNYQRQLAESKELMKQIDDKSFYLLEENKALREVLQPLSEMFDSLPNSMQTEEDDRVVFGYNRTDLTVGILRNAHTLLNKSK